MQYQDLGKFIRYKRKQTGVSLNKFAIDNDIDSAILSRIETQKQDIKLNILNKIAKGFNMLVSEFISEYENSVNQT